MAPTAAPQPGTAPDPTAADGLARSHREITLLFEQVSDPDADRPAVLQVLIRRVAAHCSAEKQHLEPVVEALEGSEDVATRLAAANGDMEKVLALVERRSVTSPDLVDLLNQLLAGFQSHVEEYEREIAPLLRPGGPLAADAALDQRISADLASEDAHPHPLLPDSGPLGRAGRAVASALDAARNKTIDR